MSATPHTCVAVRDDEALLQACGALVLSREVSASTLAQMLEPRRHVGPVVPSRPAHEEHETASEREGIAWDLSLVTDMDARGLGALAEAARKARDRGVRVSVRAASAVVHRLAALAKLDTVIPGDWSARGTGEPICSAGLQSRSV
jgi:ABC-type transporter Mla MlaB component